MHQPEDIAVTPLQPPLVALVPHVRHCGVDLVPEPSVDPRTQCFAANLEVLAAVEGNAGPSFQDTLCRVDVHLPLAEHSHHEIDALLSPQLRHSMAVGHLLQQGCRLQGH
eukprot:3104011-Pyramimonas_sp.AAC.1